MMLERIASPDGRWAKMDCAAGYAVFQCWVLVAEEEGHAFDVQLPGRVEALVVEVREPADGGGEMARVADGPSNVYRCALPASVEGDIVISR